MNTDIGSIRRDKQKLDVVFHQPLDVKIFTDIIEPNGCLIYFEADESIQSILPQMRADINTIGYTIPDHELADCGLQIH